MNIPAISAYTAKTNSKQVAFGKINSIKYKKPGESKEFVVSEGDLTINGVKGHWDYSIKKTDDEDSCPIGCVSVRGKNTICLASAECYFPNGDYSCTDISSEKDMYFNEAAFGTSDEKFKKELLQDAKTIIFSTAAHMVQKYNAKPC